MKKIPFVLLLLLSLSIKGQTLVSSDKLWSTMQGPVSGCSSYFCRSYYTKFEGDTLVDGIHYMKVLRSEDQPMQKWIIQGFIREDNNKKIFYRDTIARKECLLYDFGCETGDTLYLNCACREPGFLVDSIKTILTDGIPRKYFYLTYLEFKTSKEVWIEGIGSTIGILNGGGFQHCLTGGEEALLCCYEAGIKKYQSPIIQKYCYLSPEIINGIVPEKAVSSVKVYPNPVSDELIVQTATTGNDYTISLFTVKGELVRTECVDGGNNPYRLNVSSLKKGIYLLRIISDSGKFAEEVIIKE
jgi:hypothetical protein